MGFFVCFFVVFPVNHLLTVDSEVHGASVFASDERVFSGVAPVCLWDGETMDFPDGDVVEPLLGRELNLHSIPQPATLHIIFVYLELQRCSVSLQDLG